MEPIETDSTVGRGFDSFLAHPTFDTPLAPTVQAAFDGGAPVVDAANPSANLLSIGGHLGALTLYTAPELLGSDIQLIPDGLNALPSNGRVREHQLVDGVSFAAVYPYLPEGRYTIQGSRQKVSIISGRVTTLEYHDGCSRIYYHPSPMFTFFEEH